MKREYPSDLAEDVKKWIEKMAKFSTSYEVTAVIELFDDNGEPIKLPPTTP